MTGAFARRKRRRVYQVGIINLEGSWKPEDWSDVPRSGTIVRVAARRCSLARALGWIFGHNSAALGDDCHQWAVVLGREMIAEPGDVCVQQPARFFIRQERQQVGRIS